MLRACTFDVGGGRVCGRLSEGPRCNLHPDPHPGRSPSSAVTRNYRHRKRRAELAAAGPLVCGICGEPIGPDEEWDAHHSSPVVFGGEHSKLVPVHRYHPH